MHGGHLRTEIRLLADKALKHLGFDYPRQNGINADALFAELQGGRFRKANDGMFAGHVGFNARMPITPAPDEVFTMEPAPV